MPFSPPRPLLASLLLLLLLVTVSAQFPKPSVYENVLQSALNPAITVSYNSPDSSTCATAFTNQKQFSGYIRLPPYTLAPVQQNYTINTFFWFVEARINPSTAPLTIYLNGGPGSSSMFGLFQETGPCTVVALPNATYTTTPNLYGWDRSSNVLFIDQPDQVGFSYDVLTNGSRDLLTGDTLYSPAPRPQSQPTYTFLNGTFGSGLASATANTTQIAAQATWHFLQTWLSTFPQYNPGVSPDNSTVSPAGINLFAESYGGQYGPVFATYFQQQNELRIQGVLPAATTLEITIASLGLINGMVDSLIQSYYIPVYAYNNSYDIQAISQVDELNTIQAYLQQCAPAITACREALAATDPEEYGDVASTNALCGEAVSACNDLFIPYQDSMRSPYDLRFELPNGTPPAAYQEYLNTAGVQAAIGASVNYTESNPLIQYEYIGTGDSVRGIAIQDLANLLRSGVRVAFIYGDADVSCNWVGGEAVSLALAALLPDYPSSSNLSLASILGSAASKTHTTSLATATPPISHTASGNPGSYAARFPIAGYADIVVNSTYVGGAVRQFGNLSFSRIYESGHFVPYYQPETAFTLFTRIIFGTDLSTGELITSNISTYSSDGPLVAGYADSAPADQPPPTCWIRDIPDSCTSDEISSLKAGEGVVIAGVWYADEADYTAPAAPAPTSSTTDESGDADKSSRVTVTGVYTATATPSPSSAFLVRASGRLVVLAVVGCLVAQYV